ncbi:MAG: lipopolysaccharide heptosyltransferase II [Verrucomicrobiales bacterium]|nr:lipopolysaccharide heptosyltransferase II [Verrucomicrobiales bacterium]
MKILILKPSSLGDVVQAIPVARLIKRHLPHSEIHWWLNADLTPLLDCDPDIARVIPFERRRWGRPSGLLLAVSEIRRLRRERYDWILDLQGLARSALVGWLSDGGLFVGLDDRREGAPALHDISVPRPSETTHAVDWYLSVLRRLEIPVHHDFDWMPQYPAAAGEVAVHSGAPGDVWIAFQPGARWENKRWPAAHFAEVAERLLAHHRDWRIAILGGQSDRGLGSTIQKRAGNRVLDLTGKLSLPGMVEWIRRCSLLVTNDTGPMHVAAALRRPVVGLFGPTHPARTGPYGQTHQVLTVPLPCAPCLKPHCGNAEFMACLTGISPDRVFRAVLSRLESGHRAPCPPYSTA